jgi:ACS family tartrate transporter-like MFS transporter
MNKAPREVTRMPAPVLAALRIPLVWKLGAVSCLTLSANIAFILSAPTILAGATGLDARQVCYLVSVGGAIRALTIVFAGWYSDRRGERFVSAIAGNLILASAFVVLALFQSSAIVVSAYLVFAGTCFTTQMLEASIWPDVLHVRLLAVACAAANSLANVGGFVAPYLWGAAKDATGSYRGGLMALPAVYLLAAILILSVRQQVQAKSTMK